jgi:hypothetical protein
MHLNHGVSSAVQSVGVSGYGKTWLVIGRLYTFVIIGGFLIIPLIVFFLFRTPESTNDTASTQGAAMLSQNGRSLSVKGAQTP